MIVLCHLFPGLTPFNVWDLPYFRWVYFAQAVDAWVAKRKKESDA